MSMVQGEPSRVTQGTLMTSGWSLRYIRAKSTLDPVAKLTGEDTGFGLAVKGLGGMSWRFPSDGPGKM